VNATTRPVARLIADGSLHCVYQPVVDLATGQVVGHEALLRGPAGTRWADPVMLLESAIGDGLLPALEAHSVTISLAAAREQSAGTPITVFVNLEPSTLTDDLELILAVLATRPAHVRVVVEVTERAFAVNPSGILGAVERLRAAGCAIALDDVGATPESLAFIPVLRPEVVKLDISLLRSPDDPATAVITGAVRAFAAESGASVVAEGVECAEDLTRAVAMGATLGQGWHWGRPTPVFSKQRDWPDAFHPTPAMTGAPARLHPTPAMTGAPARLHPTLAAGRPVRLVTSRELDAIARAVVDAAAQSRVLPMLLVCFARADDLTPDLADRYSAMADLLPFVGVLTAGRAAGLASGVHTGALGTTGTAGHAAVVVLGAHEAVALSARPVSGGMFELVVTHDRDAVTAVARTLLDALAA
jgi:EAL domain-containing protein (putative c-di-GMP-specific phosphodiesterase class I)